jgi:hypothetical protein
MSSALAFENDKWHADLKAIMAMLKEKGLFKVTDLEPKALKALQTLPNELALVCLKQIEGMGKIPRINVFMIKTCAHLRNQWTVDAPMSSSEDEEDEEDKEVSEAEARLSAAAEALSAFSQKARKGRGAPRGAPSAKKAGKANADKAKTDKAKTDKAKTDTAKTDTAKTAGQGERLTPDLTKARLSAPANSMPLAPASSSRPAAPVAMPPGTTKARLSAPADSVPPS